MVWGLFPADPLSGETEYYIFSKGTYKVGRKGCDVIITKDKGVSRIHAHIVVDDMSFLNPLHTKADPDSRVRVRDCSKYGTVINKNIASKQLKVQELPNKEARLTDGDLVSFGTGSATYRFCFVPFIFSVYCFETFQVDQLIQEKISSIGARITYDFSAECTHVLVHDVSPVGDAIFDAVVAKKPVVLLSWVELVAEQDIRSEIPSWTSHLPTLTLEGMPIEIADPTTRAKCLEGYTCLLQSIDKYKFRNRLLSLLEVGGATVLSADKHCSNSKGMSSGESSHILVVIPSGSTAKFDCSSELGSLYRVNEMDIIRGILSGHVQSSTLILPAPISSSCSTDETIVADSDGDAEIATSIHATANICSDEVPEYVDKADKTEVPYTCIAEDTCATSSTAYNDGMNTRKEKVDESAKGNYDIFYTQDLIVRDLKLPRSSNLAAKGGLMNFKRFKKETAQSGNSFDNLIPFAKNPYENEEMLEATKEGKKRKQMEDSAEDLFNNEKARRRGVAGSILGLFTRA